MTQSFEIGLTREGAERERALSFIRNEYLKHFSTTPPLAMFLFAAWRGSHVVGTMGLDAGSEKTPVPLQRMYRHDPTHLPLPATAPNSVQFGRWIATIPKVSGPLTYVAARHGRSLGKQYGWCEHTHAVHRVALRFGIIFHPIQGASLLLEEVAPENRVFYEAQPMSLYLVDLDQVLQALEPRVSVLVAQGKLKLRQ